MSKRTARLSPSAPTARNKSQSTKGCLLRQGGVFTKQSRPHVNPYIYDDIKTIRDHEHLSAHGGARFYLADAFPAPYNSDPSKIVRLYLASAIERLPFADRWQILAGLLSHADDIDDHNLPRMYWFALEPMVPGNKEEALKLVMGGKIPKLQEFVARRMVMTGNVTVKLNRGENKQDPKWQWTIQKVAPGFSVRDVGEKGVVLHDVFRNRAAFQTHPLDQKTPSSLFRRLRVLPDGETKLNLSVSHHPHGNWQLRVLANEQVIADEIVGSRTVSANEWLDVTVDLTPFAGKTIDLTSRHKPKQWQPKEKESRLHFRFAKPRPHAA